MPGGRPREYDREAVGKEFIQWVLDHPDCLTVPHFTTAKGYCTDMLIQWAKDDLQFRRYYMEAKELIGLNRLRATCPNNEKDFKLDKTIYLRHVGNFDRDKRAFDREEKEHEAQLAKQKNDPATTQEISNALEAVLDQVSKLQSNSSKVDNKINSDK